MNTSRFLEHLQAGEVLVSDGATGTNLQTRGFTRGTAAETWVLEQPDKISGLHRDFIAAGADILLTCTFGGSTYRLDLAGLKSHSAQVNSRAVELARQAAGSNRLVAGSMGPLGQLLAPMGPLDPGEATAIYAQQAQELAQAGVDFLVVETQYDLAEASAACQAIRSVTDLPVVCSFSFDRGVRTMMGTRPTQVGGALTDLGVDVIGINCGRSLEDNLKALEELRVATSLPIWFKPNAGLPRLDEQNQAVYDVTPELMAAQVPRWLAAGVQVVGGCCGTTPLHLAKIAEVVHQGSRPNGLDK